MGTEPLRVRARRSIPLPPFKSLTLVSGKRKVRKERRKGEGRGKEGKEEEKIKTARNTLQNALSGKHPPVIGLGIISDDIQKVIHVFTDSFFVLVFCFCFCFCFYFCFVLFCVSFCFLLLVVVVVVVVVRFFEVRKRLEGSATKSERKKRRGRERKETIFSELLDGVIDTLHQVVLLRKKNQKRNSFVFCFAYCLTLWAALVSLSNKHSSIIPIKPSTPPKVTISV